MDIITIDSVDTGWWYLITALGVGMILAAIVSKRFVAPDREFAVAIIGTLLAGGLLVILISFIDISSHTIRLVEKHKLNALETQLEVSNIERLGEGYIGIRDDVLVYATLIDLGDNRYLVEWSDSN